MANPKPDPEAAHRGREKGWATLRRRKEDKLAAELRERGWTCQPPEDGLWTVASDQGLSLEAKGLYLTLCVDPDLSPTGAEAAAWDELVDAEFLDVDR